MRIAVIGSGISGLVSAWLLSKKYAVTLFEANDYVGGHTHTHDIVMQGVRYRVDTGFIVYNTAHYPLLTQLFAELDVQSQPTTMSFSVRNETSGLEYNAASLGTLFCQRRNLLSRRFLGMIRDLLRFYRQAPALLASNDDGPTLGEFLAEHCYGAAFRDEHLVPMAAALWSAPPQQVLAFPARYLVQFMANHQMLQVMGRSPWRVVRGGSTAYVVALRKRWSVTERVNCPVLRVNRRVRDVEVATTRWGVERFDQVVFASHSDQTLGLVADASRSECSILGAIGYQPNEVVLHTDTSVMPRNRKAWAAWNALVSQKREQTCTVSYCMNLLQGLSSPEPLIVSLNSSHDIDPRKILRQMRYAHPVYSHESVAARARKAEIQGQRHSWFAGAYWGWGFHEDGIRSAVDVATALGAPWQASSTQEQSAAGQRVQELTA